jgi:hypothetical protein
MAADPIKKRAKAHTRYRLTDGTEVPGTTTVLGVLAKPALIHWAWDLGMQGIDYKTYKDVAANIGTLAHYMVQCDLSGERPDLSAYTPDDIDKAENALLKWYEWRKTHKIEPVLIEAPLVSEQFRFGGTIDCYAMIDGVATLCDFKTGKAIYPEYITQLAAYRQLLRGIGKPVQQARIIRIGRDETEGFEERMVTDFDDHWELFKHCLAIYNLKKKVA